MSWEHLLQDDPGEEVPLLRRIEAMFAQQRATWPALRDGEAALAHLRKKTLTCGDDRIVVQFNPARRRSTHATVDTQTVSARPCFLCPANMPAEERGVAFEDLVVMPNPFPVLPCHCTIADRRHRPQRIAGRLDTLLRLTAAVGPDMGVFYNGPRCGASAPDHFHFQAANADEIRIFSQLPLPAEGEHSVAQVSFGRPTIIVAGPDAAEVQRNIERVLDALRELNEQPDEPMFNLLTHYFEGRYVAVLFPRARHRPQRFYAEGPERLGVSPAVLEMAGVMVVVEPDEFDRIDAGVAHSIYEEVGLQRDLFDKLVESIISGKGSFQ